MERDKLAAGDQDLYIVDAYNRRAYPWDAEAKQASQEGGRPGGAGRPVVRCTGPQPSQAAAAGSWQSFSSRLPPHQVHRE